jgi:hypothetical protein
VSKCLFCVYVFTGELNDTPLDDDGQWGASVNVSEFYTFLR